MAAEEKTEQATPRKREDARKKGQVVKSMEVNATVGLLASMMALKAYGPGIVARWQEFASWHLAHLGGRTITDQELTALTMTTMFNFLQLSLPLLGAAAVAGLTTNLVQTGFVFSQKALSLDFSRLNPLQGFTNMFSQRSSMEIVKSTLKASLVGYIIYAFFCEKADEIVSLITRDPAQIGSAIMQLCMDLVMKAMSVLAVIAVADYIFQRWQFEKNLRMTKQEVKEEYKRTEGDPTVKGRIRQLQRDNARRRMMADVTKATVVLTNPTHLAVALRYEPGELAPRVVAKGQRLVAVRIKEIAGSHGIPVIENKPLARALFAQCKLGAVIPVELYQAVAEIIAFVYKQSDRTV